MSEAGYNPRAMKTVFEMMSKTIANKSEPSFLSDHPTDANRIQAITRMLETLPHPETPQIPIT